MLPLLGKDDIVYFDHINKKKLQINDLVLVRKNKNLFVHRIIYKNYNYLITKGDNNPLSDGKIVPNQIIAKVKKIKKGGHIYTPENIYHIQSSYYLKEIIKIKSLLEKNKINYVFLKGLPLHLFYQKSHPKRLYSDCDLLVDRSNQFMIANILKGQGYSSVDTLLSKGIQRNVNTQQEITYQKIFSGFPIKFDVHFEPVFMMTQLPDLDVLYPKKLIKKLTEELLNNKQLIKIDNQTIYILNPKFLIIYLSFHFFHHNYQGVHRLEFIDRIIRKLRLKQADWNDLKNIINNYSLQNFIEPVFYLLRKYFKTPFPSFMKLQYFKEAKNIDIFDSEGRFQSGIGRFKNLFLLSPRPLIIKSLVFLNPQVIYLIFFVLKKKLFYFLKDHLKIH